MQRPDEKKTGTDWNWTSYFAAKKQKLQQQYNLEKNECEDFDETKSLFKNIGIFVNGYTNPTAIELKALMIKHGGLFFEYMNERVNYIVASNLAHSKALALKNRTVIKPEWIVESIRAKKLLNIENYLLITSANDKAQNKLTNYINNDILKKEGKFKRKSENIEFIDLSQSPLRENIENNRLQDNDGEKYLKDYLDFKEKLEKFKCITNSSVNIKNLNNYDKKIEWLKNFLNDWIIWTCCKNHLEKNLMNRQQIDQEDVSKFQNYLSYTLLNCS
ncbi:DNA repair REV1 [Brachionus plicatilis]|uniref:DNA repair REV1 n=1 Tax=Brachionus plicatilis TaxID=10195 RepID=A0A3M7P7K3_BRAPC|nr:DNA repair REV1 [Brachionus plicatilis]